MKAFLTRVAPGSILFFSFLGLADAAYLAQSELGGQPLICNINGLSGCNIVAQSAYAHLFGIPLGVYGLGFYGLLLALAAVEIFFPEALVRKGIQAVTTIGFLASLAFMYLQFFVIGAICIYCTISAVLALFVWLLALALPGFSWRHAAPPAALFLFLAVIPFTSHAATFTSDRNLISSDSTPGNSYLAGGSVTVVAPVEGDLSAAGGSITVSAPVAGDALLAGGSVSFTKPVAGDARIAGGSVTVSAPVAGDLFVAAGNFTEDSGTASTLFVSAITARLLSGSAGPVTVYGSTVYLAGTFAGDVRVVASDRVVLSAQTHIKGTLTYEAPEAMKIPSGALIDGGTTYAGASFLPTGQETEAFALAGVGVFLFVKILGALIATGLIAGLFPAAADRIAERVLARRFRRTALYTLLGFAIAVAAPVLILLLALTFVGLGLALITASLYVLALSLAYCYAGVIVGAKLARYVFKRNFFTWRDAVAGMLLLSVIALIPVVGPLLHYLVWAAALGSLVSLGYEHAFASDAAEPLFEAS